MASPAAGHGGRLLCSSRRVHLLTVQPASRMRRETAQPTSEEKAWGDRWSTDSLSLCSASSPAAPAPSTAACAGAGAVAAAVASPPPAPLAEDATYRTISGIEMCWRTAGMARGHQQAERAVACSEQQRPPPIGGGRTLTALAASAPILPLSASSRTSKP